MKHAYNTTITRYKNRKEKTKRENRRSNNMMISYPFLKSINSIRMRKLILCLKDNIRFVIVIVIDVILDVNIFVKFILSLLFLLLLVNQEWHK